MDQIERSRLDTFEALRRENRLLQNKLDEAVAEVDALSHGIELLHDVGIYNYRHPLENAVAYQVADTRVNRINLRREYFHTTPLEVKTELADIAGNLLQFMEHPEAAQYRSSERIRADEITHSGLHGTSGGPQIADKDYGSSEG